MAATIEQGFFHAGSHTHHLPQPHAILSPPRPWLALYNRFLTYQAPPQSVEQEVPQAPIQMLPDELLLIMLSKLPAYCLGMVACTCKSWRSLVEHPRLWERACQEALQLYYPNPGSLQKLVANSYRKSWKRLFLEHPHLRFDGLYVSRNTYVKNGVAEWQRHRPVHVVVYYRYYRFFPDGTLLYRTSPQPISKIAKSLSGQRASFLAADGVNPSAATTAAHIFVGRYVVKGTKVWSVVRYPNSWATEIRCVMSLRSTHPGANNRLDLESLFSFDRETRHAASMDGSPAPNDQDDLLPGLVAHAQAGGQAAAGAAGAGAAGAGAAGAAAEAAAAAAHRREHKRGLSSCVFVPWEQVHTSVLNLPAHQMDFFMPG